MFGCEEALSRSWPRVDRRCLASASLPASSCRARTDARATSSGARGRGQRRHQRGGGARAGEAQYLAGGRRSSPRDNRVRLRRSRDRGGAGGVRHRMACRGAGGTQSAGFAAPLSGRMAPSHRPTSSTTMRTTDVLAPAARNWSGLMATSRPHARVSIRMGSSAITLHVSAV